MRNVVKVIDDAFETFMRDVAGMVPAGSPEWFAIKKGYIAGLAAGSDFSSTDENEFLDQAAGLYEACDAKQQMVRLFDKVPAQFRVVSPNGEKAISEQGMIHLTTALEQEQPERAGYYRHCRYLLQRMYREAPKPE